MDENKVIGKKKPKFSARDAWQLVVDHGGADFGGDLDDCNRFLEELQEEELQVLEHFAGYVVRKAALKFVEASCEECSSSLQGEDAGSLLSYRNMFNALNIPSKHLLVLLSYLEKKINDGVGDNVNNLLPDTFFNIFRKIDINFICAYESIGCDEHRENLITRISHFYVITRMYFIIREAKKFLKNSEKARQLKKQSKLVT